MNAPSTPSGRFADARRILEVAEHNHGTGPDLPFPSICRDLAAFNFTHIIHAKDAAESVARAEMILSYELGVEFEPRPVPRIGSAEHYILEAFMPSGLRVDIVAKAEHMSARRDPKLVAA